MLVNCVFGIVAAVLMSLSYFANSYEMIIIGRFIVGINCGKIYYLEINLFNISIVLQE